MIAEACMVLALHGGGFIEGGPKDVQPVVDGLRRQGIMAKAARYPLGRGLDVAYRSVLRQVRRHQRRGCVVTYGHSAGAIMGLWMSAVYRVPTVAMNPLTDLPGWKVVPGYDLGARKATWGSEPTQSRLSPLRRLNRRSGRATILHSSNDTIAPYSQSVRYVRRARRLRVRGVRLVTTRTNHFADHAQAVRSLRRLVARRR